MSYQVLARKWRPRSFATMVGQEHVLRALINALDNERLHHAYLFTGTRGVGKTTVARIFAKSLNCEQGVSSTPCGQCSACTEIDEGRFVDLIEVDAASRTKVEDTRELLENVQYAPVRGRFKVYLIDEVHMLSINSFNALLKTLEEPPPHVKFLLATTDPQKLPVTILSRCLQFNLKRMSPEMIAGHLTKVLGEEQIEAEPRAIDLISEAADGSMRDALSLLDQAIAYGAGRLVEAEVRAMLGSVDRSHIHAILQALAQEDAQALLAVSETLAMQGADFSGVLAELISQLHKLALAQLAPQTVQGGEADKIKALAETISPEDIQLFYQIGLNGRRDLPFAPEQRAGFEMILLRMLAFRPVDLKGLGQPVSGAQSPQSPRSGATQTGAATSATSPAASSGLASVKAALKGKGDGGRPSAGKSDGAAGTPVTKPAAPRQAVAVSAELPPFVDDAPPLGVAPAATGADSARPAARLESAADWRRLVESLGLQGMAYQLALNSVFTGRRGNTLELSLAARHSTLRIPTMEQRLQQALQKRLGEAVVLSYTVAAEVEGQETPAALQQREARDRHAAAVAAILADANVQRICETFDGRVIEESVQPVSET